MKASGTALLGRDRELEILIGLLDQEVGQAGGCVIVTGEAARRDIAAALDAAATPA